MLVELKDIVAARVTLWRWALKDEKLVRSRTDEEWDELLRKKHGGGKKGGASASQDGGGSQGGGGSQASCAGSSTADFDPLAALLNGKQKRDEEDEQTRASVAEEMSHVMDQGIRVDARLKALYK